jgi:hypothetical protein
MRHKHLTKNALSRQAQTFKKILFYNEVYFIKMQYLPQLVPVAVTVEHNSPVSVILHLHLENTACITVILTQPITKITHTLKI